MKRLILSVAVLVLGFATVSAAQEKTMTQAQVLEMAKAIATAQGIKVIDDPAQQPTAPAAALRPIVAGSDSYQQYIARELAQQKVVIDAFMAQNTGGPINYQQYQSAYPSGNALFETRQYGTQYYNYGSLLGEGYIQGAVDRATWGGLKFKKGREAVMENIEVWGCGDKRIIQADEANNIHDRVALVPVNCSPLTFTYTDQAGVNMEVEINELIVPLRLQASKNITLNEKFFAGARKRTKFLLWDMVEEADGSFKRVRRQ